MEVAISANHAPRIMWVYNTARGTELDKHFYKCRTEPLHLYELQIRALSFFCDAGLTEYAQEVYRTLTADGCLQYDCFIKMGHDMRAQLAKGEKVSLPSVSLDLDGSTQMSVDDLSTVRASQEVINDVAKAFMQREETRKMGAVLVSTSTTGTGGDKSDVTTSDAVETEKAILALRAAFSDVDIDFVLRHVRFGGRSGKIDLLENSDELYKFTDRCLLWLETLSKSRHSSLGEPLPYMMRSKASAINHNLRIAAVPTSALSSSSSESESEHSFSSASSLSPRDAKNRLLPCEQGAEFHFTAHSRFVQETYPTLTPEMPTLKYHARQPIHREIPVALDLTHGSRLSSNASSAVASFNRRDAEVAVVHQSVQRQLDGSTLLSNYPVVGGGEQGREIGSDQF